MFFALLGKYDPAIIAESFARERQVMENPPVGVKVLARYARVSGRGGFIHIVKADSAEQLGALLLELVGVVEFDVIPVVELTETEGIKLVEEYLGDIPMHGPL